MDCSPPGSSVYGISQGRILEWVAISFSWDLPDPGIEPASPALAGPVNRSLKRQTTLSYIPELIIKYSLSHRPTWHDLASSSSSPSRDNIDRQSEV